MRVGPTLFRLARLYARARAECEIPGRERNRPDFMPFGLHSSTGSIFPGARGQHGIRKYAIRVYAIPVYAIRVHGSVQSQLAEGITEPLISLLPYIRI